jgi:hypothetical protein
LGALALLRPGDYRLVSMERPAPVRI